MSDTFTITKEYKDKLDKYLYDIQKAAQRQQEICSTVELLCMSMRSDLAEMETVQ